MERPFCCHKDHGEWEMREDRLRQACCRLRLARPLWSCQRDPSYDCYQGLLARISNILANIILGQMLLSDQVSVFEVVSLVVYLPAPSFVQLPAKSMTRFLLFIHIFSLCRGNFRHLQAHGDSVNKPSRRVSLLCSPSARASGARRFGNF